MKPTVEQIRDAGGYSIVYADPPWQYAQKGRGAAENHYQTMSLAALKALPVEQLSAKDAVLFLWVTGPMLKDGIILGNAWGFDFKTIGFTWVKYHEPSGKPAMGGGMWTRANAELCLLFVRGEPPRRVSAAVRQLVETHPCSECGGDGGRHPGVLDTRPGDERLYGPCPSCGGGLNKHLVLRAPRGAHSAKPPEVRHRIDELMGPDLPRVELFARERAPGWDVWGNEIDSDFEMEG